MVCSYLLHLPEHSMVPKTTSELEPAVGHAAPTTY